MFGCGRGGKIEEFRNLADAKLALPERQEGSYPVSVRKGLGYGDEFFYCFADSLFRYITKCRNGILFCQGGNENNWRFFSLRSKFAATHFPVLFNPETRLARKCPHYLSFYAR